MKKFISGFLVAVILTSFTLSIFAENNPQTLLSQIYQNATGDIFKVFNKNNQIQVKLGSAGGTGDNIGGTLILYNNDESKPRVSSSIRKDTGSGFLHLQDNNNISRLLISAQQRDNESGFFLYDKDGNCVTSIRETYGYINNDRIVTQDVLTQKISDLQKQIDDLKKQR
jgi:hypothetical protein